MESISFFRITTAWFLEFVRAVLSFSSVFFMHQIIKSFESNSEHETEPSDSSYPKLMCILLLIASVVESELIRTPLAWCSRNVVDTKYRSDFALADIAGCNLWIRENIRCHIPVRTRLSSLVRCHDSISLTLGNLSDDLSTSSS